MSLSAAMNIGRTGLVASQLGIQIASNNIANVATPGYSRQVGVLSPIRGNTLGANVSIGNGVLMSDIRRQVDEALQQRLLHAGSDQAAANQYSGILSQIESALGELNNNDLSSEFTAFFSAWSESANQTQANSTVVQSGQRLADFMSRLRGELVDQKRSLDGQLSTQVDRANSLISTIADLNRAVSSSEGGGGTASALRDQRGQALTELSQLMDITVVDQGSQGLDVLVGSMPVILGSQARNIEVQQVTQGGSTQARVRLASNHQELSISSGAIGASITGRDTAIDTVISTLDTTATQLAFEVNRLHSTGTNGNGFADTTGTLSFTLADRTLALNDPNNQATSVLPYSATHGGFTVTVRDDASGASRTVRIPVDLDGIDDTGQQGFSNDTSVEDIRAALDAVDGIHASFTADGKLQVTADGGSKFSFSDDTSGALAVLGVNSFFVGTDASNLQVRSDLVSDPSQLTTGRIVDGEFVENGTSLEIAKLQDKALDSLHGQTIAQAWRDAAQAIGVQAAAATTTLDAATSVQASLQAQRDGISGVSVDEESINLLNFQRMYQASARVISVADELTQTLLNLV
jgi:flagellar hook-associated protein 1 FlgK